jgi:hypothetical protein
MSFVQTGSTGQTDFVVFRYSAVTNAYGATIDFVSKVTKSRSNVYENVCSMSL